MAPRSRCHGNERVFGAQRRAAQVGGDEAVPLGHVAIDERRAATRNTGIVDQHIEAAERLERPVDEIPDLPLDGHVADHRQRAATGGAHLAGGGVDVGFCRAHTTTSAPARAKASAAALPMPLPAPVTSATWPSREMLSAIDTPFSNLPAGDCGAALFRGVVRNLQR